MADRKSLHRALGLALSGILVALLLSERAGAVSAYLSTFNEFYGTSGTRLDSCGLCQASFSSGSGGRNPFGAAFELVSSNAQDPIGAVLSLHEVDPDPDGSLSITEIDALFMPGWSCANRSPGDVLTATTSITCR